jgi:DNA-binding NarL/FixJ family response regulator
MPMQSAQGNSSNSTSRKDADFLMPPPEPVHQDITKRSKILVMANDMGFIFKDMLTAEGFEVNVVESYGRLDEVYSELDRLDYDIVIPTNNSLMPAHILDLVSGIKLRFPGIRIMVISGYNAPDFVLKLQEYRIDGFFPLPFEVEKVLPRIKELLNTQT